MIVTAKWKEKLNFFAQCDGHLIAMDSKSPLGDDSAMTPKQLVVAGLCGCTAMDVAALLKKYKQPLESFEIEAEVEMTEAKHPIVFKSVEIRFHLTGHLDAEKVIEAVTASQTKYCGVSAMLSKAVEIQYTVDLNGEIIHKGKAEFAA